MKPWSQTGFYRINSKTIDGNIHSVWSIHTKGCNSKDYEGNSVVPVIINLCFFICFWNKISQQSSKVTQPPLRCNKICFLISGKIGHILGLCRWEQIPSTGVLTRNLSLTQIEGLQRLAPDYNTTHWWDVRRHPCCGLLSIFQLSLFVWPNSPSCPLILRLRPTATLPRPRSLSLSLSATVKTASCESGTLERRKHPQMMSED